MPVAFDQMNAKTSHYQNNGPLNALVHVLVNKMADIPFDDQHAVPPTTARADLCAAFHAEWGTYLDYVQLQEVLITTTDPMHREMLLGPVLKRMLPDDETGQGDTGSSEVSVDAVATLGKRFGIRVECYKDYAGIKAEIREKLLKQNPDAEEDALRHFVDKGFKSTLGPEIKRKFMDAPHNLSEAEAILRTTDELQRILAGETPRFQKTQEDSVRIEAANRLAEGDAAHIATLILNRVENGYRFGMSNHNHPNINTFDAVVHHLSEGYKKPCDYAQAAPVLREQLRAAVTTAVAAAADNNAARQAAISSAMQNNTSRLFSEYQTSSAKVSQTAGTTKGGLGGMMDGLLGNVSTFFSDDIFGSLKGITGLLESLFGPLMKMLMGFQETMLETAKKPGDPFSKKEMEKYTAKSEELGKATSDFSIRVETLGADNSSARLLNEAWRADPDSIGVWASLIDKLVAESELAAANDCLSNQERRLLEKLAAIAASSDDDEKQAIENTIHMYQEATNPLARAMSHPTVNDALKHESLKSRLGLFKELHIKAGELSSKHARFTEATMKRGKLTVDQALVASERATAEAMGANTLVARFTAAQTTLTNLLAESAEIIGNNRNFTTQFSLIAEPVDQRVGAAFGIRGAAPAPTTNLGQCAVVAEKVRALRI